MSSAAGNNGCSPATLMWFENCCNEGFFPPLSLVFLFKVCLPQNVAETARSCLFLFLFSVDGFCFQCTLPEPGSCFFIKKNLPKIRSRLYTDLRSLWLTMILAFHPPQYLMRAAVTYWLCKENNRRIKLKGPILYLFSGLCFASWTAVE